MTFPNDTAPGLSPVSINVEHVKLISTTTGVTLTNVSAYSEPDGDSRQVSRSSFVEHRLLGDIFFVAVCFQIHANNMELHYTNFPICMNLTGIRLN